MAELVEDHDRVRSRWFDLTNEDEEFYETIKMKLLRQMIDRLLGEELEILPIGRG